MSKQTKHKPFYTPKGTELEIMDLRGKAYMPVQQRVLWFREEKPGWTIGTDLVRVEENGALFKATISDEAGRVLSVAHKYEDRKGFADFYEKAETGAIGRALANVGYGTQFAVELLEADAPEEKGGVPDFVDGPVNYTGDYIVPVGKYKGQKLSDLSDEIKEEIVDKIAAFASERGINLSTDRSEQSELYRQIINTFTK